MLTSANCYWISQWFALLANNKKAAFWLFYRDCCCVLAANYFSVFFNLLLYVLIANSCLLLFNVTVACLTYWQQVLWQCMLAAASRFEIRQWCVALCACRQIAPSSCRHSTSFIEMLQQTCNQPPLKVLGRRHSRLLLRDKHVLSRLVVHRGSTTEELIVGANKDVFRLYLKGGARLQSDRMDKTADVVVFVQFSIRQPARSCHVP